ncbi:MAG: tetratricopeptide repeat protein, partial [bacterium]|nr:tetratricopeptide repeat protein [bacterium]
EAMEYIQANEGTGGGTENGVTLGLFLIAADRPAEAVEVLSIYTSGKRETTSGWYYPITHYYLGKAHEVLGNTDEAIAAYQEMLRYWSDSDIELDEIKDARERLARLVS